MTAETFPVAGLDLSLSRTGCARIAGPRIEAFDIKPPASVGTGRERLDWIVRAVLAETADARVIAVETVFVGALNMQTALRLAGLRTLVTQELWRRGKVLVDVLPQGLKQYATGKPQASKDEVLAAAIRRFPGHFASNDAADALVLAAMVADYYGFPVAEVPKSHAAALRALVKSGANRGKPAISWPDLAGPVQATLAV